MTDSSAPFTFKGKGRSPPSSTRPTFTFVYPPAAGQPAWTAQNADDEPPPPGSSSYAKPLSKASKKGLPRKPRKKVKLENAGVEEGERTESDETNDESPMEPRKDNMDYIKFDMADIAAAGAHKRKRDDYSSPARDRTAIMQSMDVLTPLPIPPWARDISQYSKDAAAMFNEEAEDYVRFIAPTAAEQAMRLLTVERIRAVAKSLWPTCEVKIFGSFETGLYLPTSDVDVVVQGAPFSENSLHNLADALTRYSMVSKVDVISKARVPIIKTVDSLTRFPCDISFNIVSGTEAAVIVQRLLGDVWCGEGIRGLMYLMKQFLAQRLLNEPFSGGLGSYALLAMVASFMKMHPLVQSGQLTPEKNLGILFLEFLELYGSNFNYFKVGIGMNSDGSSYYFNKQMRHQRQTTRRPGILTILDPQDNTNDVGAGAYNFHYIRTEFTRAHARVTTMIGAYFQRQMKILAAPRHSSSKRSSSRHTHRHYDSDDSDDNVGKPKSEHTHPNPSSAPSLLLKGDLWRAECTLKNWQRMCRPGSVDWVVERCYNGTYESCANYSAKTC
ncbi:hypothetical protein BC829DRAFT_368731 [Chytridium lagenaria]|nr:hypothetical protein BC829DRAFT_368731 [Chytridium lagenaria]